MPHHVQLQPELKQPFKATLENDPHGMIQHQLEQHQLEQHQHQMPEPDRPVTTTRLQVFVSKSATIKLACCK
jgi:hypothetical protein